MRFNFNDKKSFKQINYFMTSGKRNCTQEQNARGMIEYLEKRARLNGSRGEWELSESIQS